MLVFAFRNLLSRPIRSLLALLGLTVAIIGMVGLFSVAEGIDYMVTSTFGKLSGVVAMQPGAPIPLFSRILDWGDEIEELSGVRTVQREIWARAHLIDGKMVISPPRFLFGIEIPSALALREHIYRDEIVEGRFLEESDRGTLNAVISRQIAEEYGTQVGDTMRVDGSLLTVVGIYHCGSILLDVAIILDIGEVRGISRFDPASVSSFYIEPDEGTDERELIDTIGDHFSDRTIEAWVPSSQVGLGVDAGRNPVQDLVRLLDQSIRAVATAPRDAADSQGDAPPGAELNNHRTQAAEETVASGVPAGPPTLAEATVAEAAVAEDEPVLEVRSAADWGERFDKFSEDLDIFLVLMTAIGVTIAVLSILNTMLMSVSERIIEFGILRANGWTSSDIMKLITWESALLGIGGGVLGASLGWLGTQLVNWYWPTKVHLFASPGLLLFSLAFSTALGVLGGLYPAIWATRMTPMDAIRRG